MFIQMGLTWVMGCQLSIMAAEPPLPPVHWTTCGARMRVPSVASYNYNYEVFLHRAGEIKDNDGLTVTGILQVRGLIIFHPKGIFLHHRVLRYECLPAVPPPISISDDLPWIRIPPQVVVEGHVATS